MDFNGIRRLYLPLRPKARFSPGRKTPPGVSAPSAGLRPLIVSRVKCGGGPCRGHLVIPCTRNAICLQCTFFKIAEDLISVCRKHVVAATRPSPFKVGDNQRPERTMSGVRKPSPESSVPGDNLDQESRRNQLRRGHGSPPVLSEVFSSLALRCALQRVQTVPAAIHSDRIPPSRQPSTRDGRLSHPPHHTGHGPFRTRPPNLS